MMDYLFTDKLSKNELVNYYYFLSPTRKGLKHNIFTQKISHEKWTELVFKISTLVLKLIFKCLHKIGFES